MVGDNPEDTAFLTDVDRGYVGLVRAQVTVHPLEDETPNWVIRKFERLARTEGISYYDFVAKYQPSFESRDWDDDAGSANEAWA